MKHGVSTLTIAALTLAAFLMVTGASCISEQIPQDMTEKQETVGPNQPEISNVAMHDGYVTWTTNVPCTGRLEYRLDSSDEWVLIIDRTTYIVNGTLQNSNCSEPGLAHSGCLRLRDIAYRSTVWYRITATNAAINETASYECSETWDTHPKLDHNLLYLAQMWEGEGNITKAKTRLSFLFFDGDMVHVVVQCYAGQAHEAEQTAETLGAIIRSTSDGVVEAWVPASRLIQLAEEPSVSYIRTPIYAKAPPNPRLDGKVELIPLPHDIEQWRE